MSGQGTQTRERGADADPNADPNLCRPSVRFQGHALRARQAASPAGSEHGHGSPKGVDAQCDSGVGVAQTGGADMNGDAREQQGRGMQVSEIVQPCVR